MKRRKKPDPLQIAQKAKRIRRRLGRTTEDRFLKELLYPPQEVHHEQP
jgi:hypothetical protein